MTESPKEDFSSLHIYLKTVLNIIIAGEGPTAIGLGHRTGHGSDVITVYFVGLLSISYQEPHSDNYLLVSCHISKPHYELLQMLNIVIFIHKIHLPASRQSLLT